MLFDCLFRIMGIPATPGKEWPCRHVFLCGLGFAENNAVRGRTLPDRKGMFKLIEFVLKIPEHLFFLRSGKETVPDAVLVYLADLFIGKIRVLESKQDILFGQIGPLDTR